MYTELRIAGLEGSSGDRLVQPPRSKQGNYSDAFK